MRQPFHRPKEAIIISYHMTENGLCDHRQRARKKQQRVVLLICCAAVGVVLLALISLLFLSKGSSQSPSEPVTQKESLPTQPASISTEPTTLPEATIPDGVFISDVSVGGMTKEEALTLVAAAMPDVSGKEGVILSVGEHTLSLTAEKVDLHWALEKAVQSALYSGEKAISVELAVDRDAVTRELAAFFDPLGGVYIPSGYWVEGDPPDLQQQGQPNQTLVLNTGAAGFLVDLQDITDQILSAFRQGETQVSLEALGDRREPKALDLQQIFSQVCTAPVNPRVDGKTLEVIPGKQGYGFDMDETTSLLESAQEGETIQVPLGYLEPADEAEAWFQDTLGYCKTEYNDNENRNENLRLACSKLNGLILQPGETLSYNELLGKRTTAAGYKPAPAYSGTELVDEVGGGICQVSSTLYLSSLFAELTIVERRNHGYPAAYIPLGLDATVNWGTTDLKIRNDYKLPVKILAQAEDGYVKVRIMGVEQRDYYVKMEYRVDDHPEYAAAFRCRYDRETDEEIYRKLDHTSIYLEDVWSNPGYAESATDEEPVPTQ